MADKPIKKVKGRTNEQKTNAHGSYRVPDGATPLFPVFLLDVVENFSKNYSRTFNKLS